MPFHAGITSSLPTDEGSNSRTLAAGWSTVKPSSSSPASVTRASRGLIRSTRCTFTARNRGGSFRKRTGAEKLTSASSHGRRLRT